MNSPIAQYALVIVAAAVLSSTVTAIVVPRESVRAPHGNEASGESLTSRDADTPSASVFQTTPPEAVTHNDSAQVSSGDAAANSSEPSTDTPESLDARVGRAVDTLVNGFLAPEALTRSSAKNAVRAIFQQLYGMAQYPPIDGNPREPYWLAVRTLASLHSVFFLERLLYNLAAPEDLDHTGETTIEDFPNAAGIVQYGPRVVPVVLAYLERASPRSVTDTTIALYGIVLTQLAEQMPDEEARVLRDRIVADGIAAERGSNQWRLMEWVQLHW